MKTLVAYTTITGNTEKVARAIFEGIDGLKEIRKMSDCTSIDDYNLIFVGFPVYNFEPYKPAADFIKKINPGTAICLFMTMSLTAAPDSPEKDHLYTVTMNNCRKCAGHTQILGIFDCPGELSAQTADALLKSGDPTLQGFGSMRKYTIGYPNDENIKAAKSFARRIIMG